MSNEKDIISKFENKIKVLEEELPNLNGEINCASLTLTNITKLLNIDNFYFNNLAVPLAGGIGGYKSSNDNWRGACGVVSGGVAAIGIIIGGKQRIPFRDHLKVYQLASKYCYEFEKEFGSIICYKLCNTDFGKFDSIKEYQENKTWKKKCYKYVIFALKAIKNLTLNDIKRKWD